MAVLLEYLDLSISVAGYRKDLKDPAPTLATPLKRDMTFEYFIKFRGMLLNNMPVG